MIMDTRISQMEIPKQVYIKAVQASQREAQYAAIVISRPT